MRDYSIHIGEKHSKLTIVSMAPSKFYKTKEGYKKERKRFVVKCDCGNSKEVDCTNLLASNTISCGCHRNSILPTIHKKVKKISDAPARKEYRNYKYTAIKKGLSFKLTLSEFMKLSTQSCNYCGRESSKTVYNDVRTQSITINGIDRLCSNTGYVLDNCVPCCGTCNYMKRNLGETEFLNHIKRIYEFQKGRRG